MGQLRYWLAIVAVRAISSSDPTVEVTVWQCSRCSSQRSEYGSAMRVTAASGFVEIAQHQEHVASKMPLFNARSLEEVLIS